MRNSSILKWAQNNKNNKSSNGKTAKEEKKWLHAPETLAQGHVVYLVKFLGSTEVDKPKGIEVVKQGIQKLKFNQQLKKSEQGNMKTPKVELTISVDGVAIQEPKTKKMLHQYPLHKISYCADDKAEKRFFSFIAKEGDTNNHTCFVFVSDKLAEDITLTIGQAFELAYKKFLDTSGKDMEMKKQLLVLQKRIAILENENSELKKRLKDVSAIKGTSDVQQYMTNNNINDICEVPMLSASASSVTLNSSVSKQSFDKSVNNNSNSELINLDNSLATKLDGFTIDDLNDDDFNPRNSEDSDNDDEFDPRAPSGPPPTHAPPAVSPPVVLSPPPPPARETKTSTPIGNYQQNVTNSIFPDKKSNPFEQNPFNSDPFGMSSFEAKSEATTAPTFTTTIQPAANFSLDELDPLKK